MKIYEELSRLEKVLVGEKIQKAQQEWNGADVVITQNAPQRTEGGFYPEPRYVISLHSLELSWLFEALRDAFYNDNCIDSCSKIEFFGRLANAANRFMQRSPKCITAHLLCAAVLHEAFAIYEEIEEGTFQCLLVAIGNEIVDDYVDEALRTGFIGTENTLAFFKSHGVEVSHA